MKPPSRPIKYSYAVYNLCTFLMLFVTIKADRKEDTQDEKILSRKRRFLVFPEGSSLQLGMFMSRIL